MTKTEATLEELLRHFTLYDKRSGKLFWKVSPSARAPVGKEVGSLQDGYLYSQITYEGNRYKFPVHKAIWFWLYGFYPEGIVDHKDNNRLNNLPDNLRLATRTENNRNRFYGKGSSQYQGVYYHTKNKKWVAQIVHDNNYVYLGSFKEEVDAAKTYDEHAKKLFGDFAHLNFLERYEDKE